MSSSPQNAHRPATASLPAVLGMQCAVLSLASGSISLVVAFLLWWQSVQANIQRIGEKAGLFSALVGLILAGIALASPRRIVRRVAAVALFVNLLILSFTLDSMFSLVG